MRVANCIMALNDPSQVSTSTPQDIQYTYMRVFRFLADVLTRDEFDKIDYYHVSRFIGNLLHLATSADENEMSE